MPNKIMDRALRVIDRMHDLPPLRRCFVLWLVGGFGALALPPLYIFPFGFFAFAFLYDALARARSVRQSMIYGFMLHLGYFMAGLYWIGHAMLIDNGAFIWMYPLAVIALPAVLSLLYGASLGTISYAVARRYRYYTIAHGAIFVVAFAILEWLRGHLLTGFPWNLTGYMFGFSDSLLQSASIFGVYGLGFVFVGLCAALAFFVRGHCFVLWPSIAVIAAMAVFGIVRLQNATHDMVPDVRLRLVQPNIAQQFKWDKSKARDNFFNIVNISKTPAQHPPTHIIWPETAVPYPVDRSKAVRMELAQILPKDGKLIFGAPRARYDGLSQITNLYNSLIVIDRDGDMIAEYNKSHLVPFGEYVPLSDIFPIKKIAHGLMDYTPGPGPQTISLGNLPPFSPLICYEVIFPGYVQSPNGNAKWLLNITNDAWYGGTAGPYQHLAHARMRAIEEGLPMIRVANSGISAVIDSYGNILSKLPLNQTGYIDAQLPQAINTATLYRRVSSLWESSF